jgi:hypothetical protein
LSLHQEGIGGGPYLGWRIRPTTIFDAWAGYARFDRSFNIFGQSDNSPVDRAFAATNLTEIIDTRWVRILPRATYYYGHEDQQRVYSTRRDL